MTEEADELPQPKIPLAPCLYFPGDNYANGVVDSTPLIQRLDSEFPAKAVAPHDCKTMKFLNDLFEDFADEWLVKAMFHYRWSYDERFNATWLMLLNNPSVDNITISKSAEWFASRQIERLENVVGVSKATAPIVEGSYVRILQLFNDILEETPFLLGERPSSADFAFYGQFSQLAKHDPTPMRVASEYAPRLDAWCEVMDDMSGLNIEDRDWLEKHELGDAHRTLLREISNIYLPLLEANAAALKAQEKVFACDVEGQKWTQNTFSYQSKCLDILTNAWNTLDAEDKVLLKDNGLKF